MMTDRVEAARTAVQALTHQEFVEHLRWEISEERPRREQEIGKLDVETDVFRRMRDQGMIPEPPEVWEPADPPMVVWLPRDQCEHQGTRWVHVGAHHTAEEPGTGDTWQEAPAALGVDGVVTAMPASLPAEVTAPLAPAVKGEKPREEKR